MDIELLKINFESLCMQMGHFVVVLRPLLVVRASSGLALQSIAHCARQLFYRSMNAPLVLEVRSSSLWLSFSLISLFFFIFTNKLQPKLFLN
jgi:hypothetical protein